MDQARAKAEQFVGRLLANPAIRDIGPLAREEQILQFFKLNGDQLYPTLSSPSFFPGQDWRQINGLLLAALRNLIDRDLVAELSEATSRIDFGFVPFLADGRTQSVNITEALQSLGEKLLDKPNARRALNGPLAAIRYDLAERYVEEAFNRREYIHFELVKVQKLSISKEEIKDLIKTSLLLRNAIHYLGVGQRDSGDGPGIVQAEFAGKVIDVLSQQLRGIPAPVIRSAINSNISFLENPKMETTARLASILAHRCHNYRPIMKVDRGADTPDKSWFSVARRNYRFYGFDVKMLDELYKMAGENGW